MKLILIPTILVLFTLFYKKNSLLCLGIFGLSYYIANCCTKNKDLCFFVAILSSFYIFQHMKVLEGNTNLDNTNLDNVRGCKEELDDTQTIACDPSDEDCDWTATKLKEKKKECKQILNELNSKETTDPEEKKKIKKDIKKYKAREDKIDEALKKCFKYTSKGKCPDTCSWGKIGSEETCNEK